MPQKYNHYRISFLGETMMVRSDVSQETLERINQIVEKAIFEVNQGKISSNKIEALILLALKLSGDILQLNEKLASQKKLEHKISLLCKNLEKISN